MNASPGSEDFDELQKLLALKRREQPPQRFFAGFSEEVLGNLDKPESPRTMSWLERLGLPFDLSPAVVGAMGVLILTLLAVGIGAAMRLGGPVLPNTLPPPPEGGPDLWGRSAFSTTEGNSQPKKVANPDEFPKSTDPVIVPSSSPFNAQPPKGGFSPPEK